jgi:hypothetical protein
VLPAGVRGDVGVSGAEPPEVGPLSPAAGSDAPQREPGRAAERVIQLLIPAVAALTLVSFLTAQSHRVDHDLHLIAPSTAAPGDIVPIRAHLFGDLDRPEGPRLLAREVTVELCNARGDRLASTRLSPGHAGSLEGSLRVPARGAGGGAPAGWLLHAHAAVEGRGGDAEKRIAAEPAALRPEPRALRALATFAPGPLRMEPGASPLHLDLAVGGGACAPEEPCELVVHTGASDVALVLAPSGAATPVTSARAEAGSPLASLWIVTHGPEAEVTLDAQRDGARVARRSFRLPIALGSDALSPMTPLYHAPALPTVRLGGEPGSCIVDAFRDGRWLRSASLPSCDAGDPVPFVPLEAGLWRLQVRRDPFDSGTAAVRALYVRAPGESDDDVLSTLARAAARVSPDDTLVRGVRAEPEAYTGALEPAARYLLALLERGVVAQPRPTSGHAAALAQLAAELARMRDLAVWALGLCGFLLVLLLVRRGLAGSGAAERVMQAAGSGDAPARRRRRLRALITVVAAAASLSLAFVAIAIYVIARSMGP